MSSTDFYRAFENRYRGSRELIKDRLRQYSKFIDPLCDLYPNASAFDIGCGRGEWLEIMQEKGFSSFGVDVDQGMLKACQDLELNVAEGDAIEYLKKLDSNSQAIVSAFHVVEHVSFEDLQIIVKESLRVLKPGGILILETPNPENIMVSTRHFYLDPTHTRPIPPQLLTFIAEYIGFEHVKLLRLQEPENIKNKTRVTLFDVFSGASPDYSIVATKKGMDIYANGEVNPFNEDYGLSAEDLISRWDENFDSRLCEIENKIKHLEQVQVNPRFFCGSNIIRRRFTSLVRFLKSFNKNNGQRS